MKIAIGNDHAATALKFEMMDYLGNLGHELVNFGTDEDASVNYPDYGEAVARAVARKEVDCGVLICGTGIGIALAANKVEGIRAASVSDPVSARLAREHNDANIICFGARIVGPEMARAILDAYLGAKFLGGRHADRVRLIHEIEKRTIEGREL